jgi:hypothetical protein
MARWPAPGRAADLAEVQAPDAKRLRGRQGIEDALEAPPRAYAVAQRRARQSDPVGGSARLRGVGARSSIFTRSTRDARRDGTGFEDFNCARRLRSGTARS